MIAAAIRNLKCFVGRHTGILGIIERLERQARALEEIGHAQVRLDERQRAAETLRTALAPFAGGSLPVYLDDSLQPMAAPQRGASPHRVVVCSIPKTGTYLVGRLLELLGVVNTGLHVAQTGMSDYRNRTIDQMRHDYLQMSVALPLRHSLQLVHRGQFTVGHLECDDATRALLAPFKKIFVYRNLRDAVVSLMRFCIDTGRSFGSKDGWRTVAGDCQQMAAFLDCAGPPFFSMCAVDWQHVPGVFSMSFEQLYGDHGVAAQHAAIRDLHRFLDISIPLADPAEIVRQLIGRPTLTWSGSRSRREQYWSVEVEERFRDLGGCELNARLGYSDELPGKFADQRSKTAA